MTDTDRELLELAAKAAGIEAFFDDDGDCYRVNSNYWDPRHDDGDALGLFAYHLIDEKIRAAIQDLYAALEQQEDDK
jgi:hypothetical protein